MVRVCRCLLQGNATWQIFETKQQIENCMVWYLGTIIMHSPDTPSWQINPPDNSPPEGMQSWAWDCASMTISNTIIQINKAYPQLVIQSCASVCHRASCCPSLSIEGHGYLSWYAQWTTSNKMEESLHLILLHVTHILLQVTKHTFLPLVVEERLFDLG